MKLIKNKKADVGEATGMTLGEIIGWIILAALIVVAFAWYFGLGKSISKVFDNFLK